MHIRNTRNGLVESVHRVSVAVVDRNEKLVASAGDPRLVTYMRSAAKPFQALPLVQDGAVEKFDITPQELALACVKIPPRVSRGEATRCRQEAKTRLVGHYP